MNLFFRSGILSVFCGACLAQDMPLSDVLVDDHGWEVVSRGHKFTDGACGAPDGTFFFADVGRGDGIHRVSPDGKLVEVAVPGPLKVSGIDRGADGRLYACLPKEGKVIRIGSDGEVVPLAEGVRPNDLVVDARGGVYFTQTPPRKVTYIPPGAEPIDVDTGSLVRPNGIAISPDGNTLYVSDHGGKNIWAFRIEPDGSLAHGSPYMTMRLPAGEEGVAKGDGMTVDGAGRSFVTSAVGIQMFDPTGRISGVIAKPDREAGLVSVAFAGEGGRWLYACNGGAVYRRLTHSSSVSSAQSAMWKPLLDGDAINGWTATPGGRWTLTNGVLRGMSPKGENRHGILLSDRVYRDFLIRFEFKVTSGNSGFYFRTERVESKVSVHGFQAEVDRSLKTGGLYETGGRQWVVQPPQGKMAGVYRPGEWTKMEVEAHGGNVTVRVNGFPTVELKGDPGRREGHFGFQLHGGQEMDVSFRKIEIKEF